MNTQKETLKNENQKEQGITLIALIITIIVLLILAGVSINATIGDNGIISNAINANLMSKFAKYNEDLGLNAVDNSEIYAVREKIKNYIPDMEDDDLDKFVIVKSKLLYVGTNEKEMEIAKKLGINGSSEGATVEEIQEIIDGVVELKDKFSEGQDSTNDNTETGFIGTKLLDRKSHLFDGTWNILIDYNKDNKETGRYENGYWLEKGKEYIINGKSLKFENDYVIDYENKDFTVLSSNKVNWNKDATLGVKDNIALDLDPMTLANGTWKDSGIQDDVSGENFFDFYNNGENTGIQKTGDVEYDSSNKALNFNEDEDNNPTGEGGYLKLNKNGLTFKNGFTFEFYGKLTREPYVNTMHKTYFSSLSKCIGMFWRTNDPFGPNGKTMRFALENRGWLCDFCNVSDWTGNGEKLRTSTGGDVWVGDSFDNYGISINNDFYMTVVYTVYDENEKDQSNFDDYMKENKTVDKINYYINGKLYGYTYYGKQSFKVGVDEWDNDNYNFLVGVTSVNAIGNLYFLKGLNYTTRLYTTSLTSDQVKLNYDMTLKYRDSFKDE